MMRFVFLAVIWVTGALAQDDARAWMNRGVDAFKRGQYAEAARDFEQALIINPESVHARLYLGTAYMAQYIPGTAAADNIELGRRAEASFSRVLELDPRNETAVAYLASLAFQQAAAAADPSHKCELLDKARDWYEKLASLNPGNKEAFYSLAVIDWLRAYPQWMQARTEAGMKPADAGPIGNDNIRSQVRAKLAPLFDDGVRQLRRALELDPHYDDAMAYMNLIVREQADLADTKTEYQRGIVEANDWVAKALEEKRIKARESAKGENASDGVLRPAPLNR